MNRVAYRAWHGLGDVAGMAAANTRLRDRLGLLDPIDPTVMKHRYTHLVNSDPRLDCRIAERDGVTVGYARVEWHDLEDGDRLYDVTTVVDPAAWGHGIADAFLDWSETRTREIAAAHPTERTAWSGNWAFGGDDELEPALERRGYRAVRWGAEMLRPDLEAIADAPLPPGYALRTPAEAELPAVFAMSVEAFREHWGEYDAGDQRLDEWLDDPRFRRDLVVVAWHGASPAACVSNVLTPAPDGSVRGLLDSVATHPDHRRRGLAKAAISESLRRLRAAGASTAYLGVDTENHNRAMTLYESCGFRIASTSTTWRRPFGEPTTEAHR